MSTIDDATVIRNLRETVERLIVERDEWKRKAEELSCELLCKSMYISELECDLTAQKGGAQ